MKMEHKINGLLSDDGNEIVGFAHERHKIGECPWCDYIRVEHITKEFFWRLDNCGEKINHLYMWSLGTSLKDTKYNRKILLRMWNKFTKTVQRTETWKPLFRVVEKGKRGYLHIHVVASHFCEHRIILNKWRAQTGEKSNVHVSGYRGTLDPRKLARYLMKYLTKESSAYRWLGAFYGLGKSTSRRVSTSKRSSRVRYGGEVYWSLITEGYVEIDQQKAINNF